MKEVSIHLEGCLNSIGVWMADGMVEHEKSLYCNVRQKTLATALGSPERHFVFMKMHEIRTERGTLRKLERAQS